MKKLYYLLVFSLILGCMPDNDMFINYTFTTPKLQINEPEGLQFENSSISDGDKFNFKTQTAGKYTIELRDHFRTLISKSKVTAQVGDNVYSFYTKALPRGDYYIILKNGTKTVQKTKLSIQ